MEANYFRRMYERVFRLWASIYVSVPRTRMGENQVPPRTRLSAKTAENNLKEYLSGLQRFGGK